MVGFLIYSYLDVSFSMRGASENQNDLYDVLVIRYRYIFVICFIFSYIRILWWDNKSSRNYVIVLIFCSTYWRWIIFNTRGTKRRLDLEWIPTSKTSKDLIFMYFACSTILLVTCVKKCSLRAVFQNCGRSTWIIFCNTY